MRHKMNKNFDETTNSLVTNLIGSLPGGKEVRRNRRSGKSILDPHLAFIFQKFTEKRSLQWIVVELGRRWGIQVHKSTVMRFIHKKLGA